MGSVRLQVLFFNLYPENPKPLLKNGTPGKVLDATAQRIENREREPEYHFEKKLKEWA